MTRALRRALIGASVLLLVAIGFAATRVGGLQGRLPPSPGGVAAPELTGISAWINSEPTSLAALRGRVVLLDFWTYSCINCVRTIPVLRALHRTYGERGLEVIGVHAPEFEFERDLANVRQAVARLGVPYAVALDADMATWRAYGNRFWPHVYLVDAEGIIRYDHIGEGAEDILQDRVRALLAEAGHPVPAPADLSATGPSAHITPEIYLGAERGAAGGHLRNPEGYRRGEERRYAAVAGSEVRAAGVDGGFFLEGPWLAERTSVTPSRAGARVVVPFFARNVFVVATGSGEIEVRVDGRLAPARSEGADVLNGSLVVDRDGLFEILALPEPERHILTLEVSPGVSLYTFTFG